VNVKAVGLIGEREHVCCVCDRGQRQGTETSLGGP